MRKKITPDSPCQRYQPPLKNNPSGYDIKEAKNNISQDLFSQNENTSLKKRKSPKLFKKIILFLLLFLFISFLTTVFFFFHKLQAVGEKINSTNSSQVTIPSLEILSSLAQINAEKRSPLAGESEGRVNILLLGIAGEGKPGGNLTDTIMIASIDTKENKVALLSLPRDLYVSIADSNYSAKINSLYKYGLNNNKNIEPLIKTIENITDLSLGYYLVVNFSGFEKFIDDIGGINVEVQRDIYDSSYPGPNYSYETFEIKKGFHNLDGATALKYARERHDDPEGDFGRAKRQQQVIQAAKNKLFSAQTFLNPLAINKLLNTLGENIKTNLTLEEINSLIKLTKNLDTQNVNTAVVDAWKKDSLLKVSHIFYDNTRAFILVPRVGNYTEIKELAKNIFDLRFLEERKKYIKQENPKIALIDNTQDHTTYKKVASLLEDKLGFENITQLKVKNDFELKETTLFDLSASKKPFSLDEIIKKTPATLSKNASSIAMAVKDSPLEYDIIIVLEKDLNSIYKYDEDSIDDLKNSQQHEEILIKTSQQ